MDYRSGVQSRGTANPTQVQQYAPDDLPEHIIGASNFDRLLQNLDVCAAKKVPLHAAAADDNLFLQANTDCTPNRKNITGLRRIVDLCDVLLASLSRLSYERKEPTSDSLDENAASGPTANSPDFTCEKFLANLEHLLLCQRQSALDAIVHHYLNIVEGALLLFYQQWLYRKSSLHDWFAEWPNGERPLSTTWPWNVKPSLIILWGVCWMFYDHNRGNNNPFDKPDQFGQDIWMRQVTTSSEAEAQAQLAYSQPPNVQSGRQSSSSLPPSQQNLTNPYSPSYSEAPIEQAGSSSSYGNYAWLQPYQAAATTEARRASISESFAKLTRGHVHTRSLFAPANANLAGIPVTPSPAIVTSDSSPSYIGVTSTGPSNVFPGPTFGGVWSFPSGTNQQQPTTFSSDNTFWQTALDSTSSVHNPFASVNQASSGQPYAAQSIRSLSAGPPGASTSHLGFGLNIQTKNMQDYPSPQLSDVSVPAEPAYATSRQQMMEGTPSMFRTSNLSSPASLMSNEGIREPFRDALGHYVCRDPSCSDGNPAFARKCEYQYVSCSRGDPGRHTDHDGNRKHIDKHLRPHICEHPGCENLRGFTYPGGLSRHQREVHRLNGGPRAACFCPHKDCKRSGGVGFTRKENLAEHVRRVHRDGATKAKEDLGSLSQQTMAGTRKRRRRVVDEGDEYEENEDHSQSPSQNPQDLRQEVKKLRRELKEKDDRLQRLEVQMERLTRAQSTGHV